METPPAQRPLGEEESPKPAQTDWLGRLRRSQDAEPLPPAEAEETPAWKAGDEAGLAGGPDATQLGDLDFLRARLGGIDQEDVPEQPAAPPPPPSAGEIPEWLRAEDDRSEASPPSAQSLPDWLRLDAAEQEPTAARPTSQGEPAPSMDEALPDWLRSDPTAAAEPEVEPGAPGPLSTDDLPAWLFEETEPAPSGPTGRSSERASEPLPDWLAEPSPLTPASPPAGASALVPDEGDDMLDLLADAQGEMPDWLLEARAAISVDDGQAAPVGPAQQDQAPAPDSAEAEALDWLSSFEPEIPEAAPAPPAAGASPAIAPGPGEADEDFLADAGRDLPDWLEAVRPQEAAPRGAEPTRAGDLPDWLEAMRPEGVDLPPAEKPARAGDGHGLAEAELPDWLRDMRPLEQIAGVGAERAAELDDYQEAAGPLAGMRGVLRAEPVVSLPGKPGASVTRLIVTDWQHEQADVFRKLMQEELEDLPAAQRRRFRLSFAIDRAIVFLLIAAAVIAPFALKQTFFDTPNPELYPENRALLSAIAALPEDSLVLAAFEYDPGAAGELGDAMEGLLQRLVSRGHRIALVSTRPLGVGVAQYTVERAFAQAQVDPAEAYGSRYVNLGYIPGGAVGLQAFAAGPREAINTDFVEGKSPWEMQAVADAKTLGDFALVVVAADSPTYSRAWLEQVQSRGVPMAAVVTAASEPLISPYAQGDSPQLVGLSSGLAGAFVNDIIAPRGASPISRRWDSFSAGILAAGLILLGGNVLWSVVGLSRSPAAARSGQQSKGKAAP